LGLEELVDALFPDGVEATSTLREAALLALPEVSDSKELFRSLRTATTQPEMPKEGNYVRVMSLHKSKGLKSRIVLVPGCVQGLLPFFDRDETPSEADATLKEQRRLFYVVITRAEQILVLSSFTRIERAFAHQIQLPVQRGGGTYALTISSDFFAELGPAAPAAKNGNTWHDQLYT
jgi:superfamily I DNA/RNA helicase